MILFFLASEIHVEAERKFAVVCSIPPSDVGIGIVASWSEEGNSSLEEEDEIGRK